MILTTNIFNDCINFIQDFITAQSNEYEKKENNRCANRGYGGRYQTLDIAKRTCDNLDNCVGIEDTDCDEEHYYVCLKGSIFKSYSGDCAWVKIQGKNNLINVSFRFKMITILFISLKIYFITKL